ncbi:type VI secretion system tube protein Hcp [Bacillus sp. 3255]|uniref:Hcp family type VI secretion system effector n=1 Tax=Bacillus sp. 3255 TaxID=2817904 RepID=UPI0028590419|nr:type VI secretion system tube protein Hcp [Bacillus sp. 3255]MDR6879769.1 type VI secretion system secreted protein Hcp [Bacillus sp. 3255]
MNKVRYRKYTYVVVLLSLLVMAFGAWPAAAAESQEYDVYLKLDGIEGESQARGFEKWIEVQSFSFDVHNTAAGASTSGAGSSAGKAVPSTILLNKNFDASSIPLFLNTVTAKSLEKGQIVFVPSGSEDRKPVITIDLEKVNVSSFSMYETNETIELSYGSIAIKYNMVGPTGKVTTVTGGWDFTKNVKK